MPLTFHRWTRAILLTVLGSASAAPVLPAPSIAAQAVRDALSPEAPAVLQTAPLVQAPELARPPVQSQAVRAAPAPQAPAVQAARPTVQRQAARATPAPQAPVASRAVQAPRPAQSQAVRAAQTRAQTIQRAQTQPVIARSPTRTGRSAVVRATAYNSLAAQTDSTPFITATGTRVRPGVVALSRDMLRLFPYGSRITIEDLSGKYNNLFRGRVFVVEDTMAVRKTGSLDVWMPNYRQAMQFGARQVRITAVR